jgi:integrase
MGRGAARGRSKPKVKGPPLFRSRRGFIGADLREYGLGRQLLRDPAHEAWRHDHPRAAPEGQFGEYTTSEVVAAKWFAEYVASVQGWKVRRQLGIPEPGPAVALTFSDEMEDFIHERRGKVAPATLYNIQGALRWVEATVGPDRDPATVTTRELQALIDRDLKAGYAQSTLLTRILSVRPFFARYGAQPCDGIEWLRADRKMKHGWDEAQVKRIREAADAVDAAGEFAISARLATELALCSGAREGELFAIAWERIEAGYRRAWITEQASRYSRGMAPTKGRKERFAILHPDWWAFHDPRACGLVLSVDGRAILQGAERQVLKRVMEKAGLKEVGEGNHKFRHTYARRFLEACGEQGVNGLPLLQLYLGHASVRTTEESYGHYGAGVRHEHALRVLYPQAEQRRAS